MKYQNKEFTIRDLLELVDKNNIDLQPPYQRNFIWTPKDQRLLIDSILRGYPLPSFFMYKKDNGSYEMVDGQQRAKTISRFAKGLIGNSDKLYIKNIDKDSFYSYRLNYIEISNLNPQTESLEEFYALVNKRGIHLNPAEVNKAFHHDSPFLKLVEEILDLPELQELEIFTDKTIIRMNDRGLIEELIAYLFRGITDKRNAVEDLFDSKKEVADRYEEIKTQSLQIITRINRLNKLKPINATRYKQRNDFYTLFCFVNEHFDFPDQILSYQYGILTFFDEQGFITPSNEDCEPFKEYALHCVSQSNSKNARLKRLEFFNAVLCNVNVANNEILEDIEEYLQERFNIDSIQWKRIEKYELLDVNQFNA